MGDNSEKDLHLLCNLITMKKFIGLSLLSSIFAWQVGAQSLSPQVIASSGGYYSNAAGSLSFTVGETVTQTYTSGSNMLTQGFQQPFELNINVKAYLQGFYVGGGQMADVLYNQGQYASPSLIADSITVELHNAAFPYALAFSSKQLIYQNGTISMKGVGNLGQSYYIVLKHRNSVETWSAVPVTLNTNTNYDFTTADSQAYANNQIQVGPGAWAIYSGDITQDGVVDAFDYLLLDPDIIAGNSGYYTTDLTGDGSVDAFDYLILDPNLILGVGASAP